MEFRVMSRHMAEQYVSQKHDEMLSLKVNWIKLISLSFIVKQVGRALQVQLPHFQNGLMVKIGIIF